MQAFFSLTFSRPIYNFIDNCYKVHSKHRCTRVENPGEGVRDVFAKIPRGGGGQGFQEKLPGGVHLFCVLLHFY